MKRSAENKFCCVVLKQLEEWVVEQPVGHFDLDTLASVEIPVPIHATDTLQLHFFQLHPDDELGPLHPECMEELSFPRPGAPEDVNELWLYHYLTEYAHAYMPLDGGEDPIIYNIRDIFFSENNGIWQLDDPPCPDPELHGWIARVIQSYKAPNIPHLICHLTSEAEGDDGRLRRGKLLCLLLLMRGRLRSRGFKNHVVVLVLLLSYMRRQHARIIEGYFDGNTLVVNKSPLYDFTKEEDAPCRLFARYILAGATGSTTGPLVAERCVSENPAAVDIAVRPHS